MSDTFTLAVLIGDVAVVISLIILMVVDKPRPVTAEPPNRPSGRRPA